MNQTNLSDPTRGRRQRYILKQDDHSTNLRTYGSLLTAADIPRLLAYMNKRCPLD